MKKISKKIIFIMIIMLFPLIKVNALDNYTINIQANKNTIIIGEEITVTVAIQNINEVNPGLTACISTLNMTDNTKIQYISVSALNGWSATYGNNLVLDTSSPILSNTNVATIKFKGVSAGTVTIKPTAADCTNNFSAFTGISNSLTITVKNPPSTNANLTNLSLSSSLMSPSFNSSVLNYSATIDSANVFINAIATSGATISGNGSKNLNYGNNSFNITVTAEDRVTKKVYNVNIFRPDNRSINNKLSSIEISAGSIIFNPNVNTYNITIPSDIAAFSLVNATAQDSKSKISYKNKTISINHGETKKINIIVTSESGVNNIYVLNVTRTDGRSDNNYLSLLKIDGVDIKFNKNTLNYSAIVDNKISNVNITALAEDSKSTINGDGIKILNIGSNTIQIKVISEKGSEKIYTIVLIKKDENNLIPGLSDNAFLKKLKINDSSFNFDKNIFKYTIYLDALNDKAVIIADKEDEKSILALNGNEELQFGENKFEITVTAENGNVKLYTIIIIRKNNLIEEKLLKNNDLIISSNRFKNAKEEYQDLLFIINNNEDKELYRWEFKIEDLKDSNITSNLDIEINNSQYNKEILKLTKLNNITNLSFKHEGKLPGISTITINMDNIYKDGDKVNLYHYDKNSKKITLIKENIVIENSLVKFDIDHCSEYFLTDTIIDNVLISNPALGVNIIYIIIPVLIIVSLGIYVFIRTKNKQKGII